MLRSKGDKDDEQKKKDSGKSAGPVDSRARCSSKGRRRHRSTRHRNRLRQLLEDLEVDKWDPEQEKEAEKKLSLAKKKLSLARGWGPASVPEGIPEETKKKLREYKRRLYNRVKQQQYRRKTAAKKTAKKRSETLRQLLED